MATNTTNANSATSVEETPVVTRDDLRKAIFEAEEAKPKSEVFKFNGVDVEWRQPTIEATQNTESREAMEGKNFMVMMLIENTFIPGTNERIFVLDDYDALIKMPMSRQFNEVVQRISGILDLGVDSKVKN